MGGDDSGTPMAHQVVRLVTCNLGHALLLFLYGWDLNSYLLLLAE